MNSSCRLGESGLTRPRERTTMALGRIGSGRSPGRTVAMRRGALPVYLGFVRFVAFDGEGWLRRAAYGRAQDCDFFHNPGARSISILSDQARSCLCRRQSGAKRAICERFKRTSAGRKRTSPRRGADAG